jgi:hypothetical protein
LEITLLVLILLVVAGLVHVAEETLTGFMKWFKEFLGFRISVTEDVVVNAIFLIALAIGALVSNTYPIFSLGAVGFVFINFWFHVIGTIKLRRYSPGLISAALLYLPLSSYAYYLILGSGSVTLLGLAYSIVISSILYFGGTFGIHIIYAQTKHTRVWKAND